MKCALQHTRTHNFQFLIAPFLHTGLSVIEYSRTSYPYIVALASFSIRVRRLASIRSSTSLSVDTIHLLRTRNYFLIDIKTKPSASY